MLSPLATQTMFSLQNSALSDKRCVTTNTQTFRTVLTASVQVQIQCCFTPTETIMTIRDGEPRTATSTFSQLLSSDSVGRQLRGAETVSLQWRNQFWQSLEGAGKRYSESNSKHWFTTSFLQPLPYLVTP